MHSKTCTNGAHPWATNRPPRGGDDPRNASGTLGAVFWRSLVGGLHSKVAPTSRSRHKPGLGASKQRGAMRYTL
eukprot:2382472-Amphidinium_carterae.1